MTSPDDEPLPLEYPGVTRWSDASPSARATIDQNVAWARDIAVKAIGAARWHRDHAPHECEPWCIGGEAITAIHDLSRSDLLKLCNFLIHLQVGGT